jgi:hypothetical protein
MSFSNKSSGENLLKSIEPQINSASNAALSVHKELCKSWTHYTLHNIPPTMAIICFIINVVTAKNNNCTEV